VAKFASIVSNTPPKGWRWEVFDEDKNLVESGPAKGEQEARSQAQAAIARLEKGAEEEE